MILRVYTFWYFKHKNILKWKNQEEILLKKPE